MRSKAPSGHQQSPLVLTALEDARAILLGGLKPVDPVLAPRDEALGCICAEPLIASLRPSHVTALRDGWAMRADDIAGASSYAPIFLAEKPVTIQAGDRLPPECDCVIDPHGVDDSGPMAQVLVEGLPGENVRRPGEDASAGQVLFAQGHRLCTTDIACAQAMGIAALSVRRPHVAIVDSPSRDGARISVQFLMRVLAFEGARVTLLACADRSAPAIQSVLAAATADLILLVGGTGSGASDHAITALEASGSVLRHGVALEPGRTAAIASVAGTPLIAVPGLFEQAFAVWLGLIAPAMERLSLRLPAKPAILPLTRKISSRVGVAEVVLLRREGDAFAPLAIGELPMQCLCDATHAMIVEAGNEGHAGGEPVAAFALPGAQ